MRKLRTRMMDSLEELDTPIVAQNRTASEIRLQAKCMFGQRDLSYEEITKIIGKAIGKPNLKYTKLTPGELRGVLAQMGMSENMARLLAEMSDSMDSGYIKNLESRSPRNTPPTSYESFVAESFLPLYRTKRQTA